MTSAAQRESNLREHYSTKYPIISKKIERPQSAGSKLNPNFRQRVDQESQIRVEAIAKANL